MIQFCFQPFPAIVTERLELREIVAGDAPALLRLRSDKQVMEFLDREPFVLEEEALQMITKITSSLDSNEGITWGISLKGSAVLVGTIGFWKTDPDNHRAEIGYMLLPELQRKGITQEALTAILQYGFSTMQLHSVEANVNPNNTASIKLLEKNNFAREAYFKENYYYNGLFLDSAIYSLLAPKN